MITKLKWGNTRKIRKRNNNFGMGFYLWMGYINQIDRKVCCLGVENGGMGMINIQEFIDSERIKLLFENFTANAVSDDGFCNAR